MFGNWHMQRDAPSWYRAIDGRLIGDVKRPLLLIDWTETDRMVSLVVTVPVAGRSIPIYAEVHPEQRFNDRTVVAEFLQTLKHIRPRRCGPIVVADGRRARSSP